ncbi:20995_t:CDS:1, partial [Dentiscutata erythropus]
FDNDKIDDHGGRFYLCMSANVGEVYSFVQDCTPVCLTVRLRSAMSLFMVAKKFPDAVIFYGLGWGDIHMIEYHVRLYGLNSWQLVLH